MSIALLEVVVLGGFVAKTSIELRALWEEEEEGGGGEGDGRVNGNDRGLLCKDGYKDGYEGTGWLYIGNDEGAWYGWYEDGVCWYAVGG